MANENAVAGWLDKTDVVRVENKEINLEKVEALDNGIKECLEKARKLLNERYEEQSSKEVYDKMVCIQMCLN